MLLQYEHQAMLPEAFTNEETHKEFVQGIAILSESTNGKRQMARFFCQAAALAANVSSQEPTQQLFATGILFHSN
jgi:hypothetical protein